LDILQPVDPNERLRRRRRLKQRRRRIRRSVAALVLVLVVGGFAFGAHTLSGRSGAGTTVAVKRAVAVEPAKTKHRFRDLPPEIRGVHVTMALASIPGRIDQYLALAGNGLNTIELDVKDENGDVAFVPSAVPLARQIGAAKPYYKPREIARKVHAAGLYLVGRIATFEDPVLSQERPELALHNADGSLWKNNAGLGWTNEYDKRVWDYVVSLGEAAARAGFDEIQFDYVRFPSDGDVSQIRYPVKTAEPRGWTIARFVHYAANRLHPLGARVSVDLFGLSATRDLGIGQKPGRLARYVDAVYPMVYPSHFYSGEYGLDDPNADPGDTVDQALADFQQQLRGKRALLVPWLQDFSLGRAYTLADVRAQIDAARGRGAAGFMLWNPVGVYTAGALSGR
jgi:hypothetical protein